MPETSEPKVAIQELAKLAAPIARNVRLRSIDLVGIEANRLRADEPAPADLEIRGGHTIRHHLTPETESTPARLFVEIKFDLKLQDANDGGIAKIRATLGLAYDLNRGMPKEAEDLLPAFVQTNSLVHVWPYYRELIQSTAWRMGLPPFPLPLFQLGGPRGTPAPTNEPSKDD